jgi:hypothetical protein
VLHLSYTARDGGTALRTAVEQAQLDLLSGIVDAARGVGLRIGYCLRQQMTGQWWALKKEGNTMLLFRYVHLPFFASAAGNVATINSVTWFVRGQFTPTEVSAGVVLVVSGAEVMVVDPWDGTGLLRGASVDWAVKLNQSFTFAFKDLAALQAASVFMELLWYTVKAS